MGPLDKLNNLTFQIPFIRVSLYICELTEHYSVRLLRQLMSYEAFHTTKEKLWQKIVNKLLRGSSCLFELIGGSIMAGGISRR